MDNLGPFQIAYACAVVVLSYAIRGGAGFGAVTIPLLALVMPMKIIVPVVTILGVQMGTVLVGSVVIESVFSWPGVGSLLFDSVSSRNYPVVLGIMVLGSLVVIAATLPVFHLPEAGLLLIIGVDHLLDMGRSATNVVGNSVAAVIVSKWESQLGSGGAEATLAEPQVG